MSSLLFPQYKHRNSLAIVGFARSSRTLAPYHDLSWDIWGLNEALTTDWFLRKQPSGWFQIHPKWDFMRSNNRNDPAHWKWLREPHDFPIFMQADFAEIPAAVRYPIEEVMDMGGMYLTSSPAMMFALGILMGYQRIGLWGIDMAADSEYNYQKPCMEYWIGIARGMGIEVVLPENCPLLRGNLYAYEDLRAADRTYLGQRSLALRDEFDQRLAYLNRINGRTDEISDLLEDPFVQTRPEVLRFLIERKLKRDEDRILAVNEAAQYEGALGESRYMIRWHDSQNIPADREDVKYEQA